ncbi:MAG: GNAT family N-acetyltransferase [Opitutaceae bacterium]
MPSKTAPRWKGLDSIGVKGWLCEIRGIPVGFVIGNGQSGELEVIAVLRAYEGKGIGRKLLTLAQEWRFSQGCGKLWLTTGWSPTRAFHLYSKVGWKDTGLRDPNSGMGMELLKSLCYSPSTTSHIML